MTEGDPNTTLEDLTRALEQAGYGALLVEEGDEHLDDRVPEKRLARLLDALEFGVAAAMRARAHSIRLLMNVEVEPAKGDAGKATEEEEGALELSLSEEDAETLEAQAEELESLVRQLRSGDADEH